MANIDTLYPRLLINAADAPVELLLIVLRDAAREFFRETHTFRSNLVVPIPVVVGTPTYTMVPLANTQLIMPRFIDFQADSDTEPRPLKPFAEEMLKLKFREMDQRPLGYLFDTLNVLELVPNPDEAGNITRAIFIVTLSNTATAIPDDLLARYEEELIDGALWRLLRIRNKPWSNQNLAITYRKAWQVHIGVARREARKSYTRGNLQVKVPKI